ncbi:hypothetical protein INP83_19730 [Mucilaginibacter sp. 21P]|uniref:hypothetical protein n=1 Tax=Mucilaginibacter sp. 21P TaxID=2778902 RepID=UPI001C56B431|nr:hypothetical protein [Mucilaginibacter sp. 21P]QXV67732.1 hypothetical protein INP83_19730 [Mucilaginibacter sp. 21P]
MTNKSTSQRVAECKAKRGVYIIVKTIVSRGYFKLFCDALPGGGATLADVINRIVNGKTDRLFYSGFVWEYAVNNYICLKDERSNFRLL